MIQRTALAFLTAIVCLLAAPPARADTCAISDIATLTACFVAPGAHERFVFTADVVCSRQTDCCPGERPALMLMNGVHGRVIDGQGHRLKRQAGQKACAALLVRNGQDITVRALTFDEDQTAAPCELSDKPCASTVDFASSKDLTLERVKIAWGKGYVVRIWNVQGFTLRQSEISDAGIIGFYAGHYRYGASARITIEGSTIARARANGAAFQGADDVVLKDNLFVGNHWHGLWPVPGGGITTGGQLLIGQGSRFAITGNRFDGNDCRDCRPSRFVTAIEVGEDAKAPGVHGLTISGNLMCYAGDGAAVRQNPGTKVDGMELLGNRLKGFSRADESVGPVRRERNIAGLAACT